MNKQVIKIAFYGGPENWIRMIRYVVVVPITCNLKTKKNSKTRLEI